MEGEEEAESKSINLKSKFKGNFEVDKAKTAVISTMKLLSDIGSSLETMSVMANSNISKE